MKNETPPPAGFDIEFISFVVFRHKWKILLFAFAGVLAAAIIFFGRTPMYESRAKLLVRYVTDTRSLTLHGPDEQIRSPDSRGENIINSELEILSSWDLALKVVDVVGADMILGKKKSGNARAEAAGFIVKNLSSEVPKRSDVIIMIFSHPDPEIAQSVLRALITQYLEKHLEIHTAMGAYDFLTQQTDKLRSRLMQTEDQLDKLRSQPGVTSLAEAKVAIAPELARLREALNEAEAETAERQARLKTLDKFLASKRESATNEQAESDPKDIAHYKVLAERLNALRVREVEMLSRFTDENPLLKGIRSQIEEVEGLKSQLELKEPRLAMLDIGSSTARGQGFDPLTEAAHLAGIDAKIQTLKSQLERVRAEATTIDQVERSTVQLQRKKELEEKNYRYLSAGLEQARIDTALDSGKMSNISVVQYPSAAALNYKAVNKAIGIALACGILGGFGLAFLIEIFLDQTIKRPSEVSARLGIPLFLTIQELRKQRHSFLPWSNNGRPKSLLASSEQTPGSPETASWVPNHPLRSYYEALRDRMVMYFEQQKMTHKPKLIGVTSCSPGAGVTTIATGLAAMLSESGDGKVLLVDLTLEHGAAHPFFRGKPACGVLDVLEHGETHSAQVLEKLHVVSANGANGSALAVRSKKFTDLMPRLKASDYDYIIFDLPHVTQTSVTQRLAGFMDKVLVVVKAEETSRDALQRGRDLLKESGASVAAILNGHRNYTPAWLHQDF